MAEEDEPIRLKIVVVGDGAAGKTTMLITYIKGEFPPKYIPTVFDQFEDCFVKFQGKDVQVNLFDTGGGEDYPRLRPLCYPETDVFLLLFDVSWLDDLEHIKNYWIPELRHHCPRVPIILIGSKIDLRPEKENAATSEQGQKMAHKIGAAKYMEISSLKGEGLTELFDEVARIGCKYQTTLKYKKQKKCTIL